MFWPMELQVSVNRLDEDALAEEEDGADDDGGDAGDQQAVLDGRSTALVRSRAKDP